MKLTRRELGGLVAGTVAGIASSKSVFAQEEPKMYGLISKIDTVPGKRDELVDILVAIASEMPGCLSYVVAKDSASDDAIWVTEAWDTQASHQASINLPAVQQAMAAGRPLIAGFSERNETVPAGGHGLATG